LTQLQRRFPAAPALAALLLVLGGCASRPPAPAGRDGPGPNPPPGLEQRPDAQPRIEPLRSGGPNKPYEMLGQRYVPLTADLPLTETGLASWYGRKFHGLPTSSGEPYDMYAMTAAHKTMPIPSYARVRNPANGREVIVRINDRGPFSPGRVIDLSYTAALKLGVLAGVAQVQVQRLTFADIRAGLGGRPAQPVEDPAPGESPTAAGDAPGWWLQLGAFRTREGALQMQLRVQRMQGDGAADLPAVMVFEDGGWYRVQAGPYASRALAQDASERTLRQMGLSALVVERAPRAP
jgi:rare lipoprotein A